MLGILLFATIALIIWMLTDFKLGRRQHVLRTEKKSFPQRNTATTLFGNGEELYASLFQAIKYAQDHVHVQFYIIRKDPISMKFLRILSDKALEGVTVRLLVDRIGGNAIPNTEIKRLKKCGVQFAYSHKPHFPFLFYSLNRRNHRKITVIDGNVGYFGGFNIGKEYIGLDPKLGFWRDFHLKILGDGVQDLQSQFIHDWERATKDAVDHADKRYFPPLQKGPVPIKFVPTDGVYLQEILLSFIHQAQEEVIIGSPYFIPSAEINDALLAARQRQVNISILVPVKSDHMFVKAAAFPYFKPLIKAGCQIYQYEHGFYHGKIFIVDDSVCDFGTANFDRRSFFINDEFNGLITDPHLVKQMKTEIQHDMKRSKPLTMDRFEKRSMFQRGKEIIASLIAGFL